MNIDINELETADYDILENVKVAFHRLWKMKLIVAIIMLIGFLVAYMYVLVVGVDTNYRSSATIFSAVYGSYEDSSAGVTVMNTYSGLLNSSRVCERAVAMLGDSNMSVEYLQNMVNSGKIYISGASTASKSYGYELRLVATADSPEFVVAITNAMAKAFTEEINELLGTSSLQILDEAKYYSSFKSMNYKLIVLLGGAVALVLSAGFIFVKEFFSVRVYSVAQCEMKKENILGLIPYNK
uniref:YveK family protein n=1 Tax=Acetatifactor sp. TaxID=1872090 RepID=UPI00405716C1